MDNLLISLKILLQHLRRKFRQNFAERCRVAILFKTIQN